MPARAVSACPIVGRNHGTRRGVAVLDRLEPFLSALRTIELKAAATGVVRPMGLLETPRTLGVRDVSIPPEAVPLIDLGLDGCHYAAWIDDLGSLAASPGVVLVSPLDGHPDAIQWVAPSIEAFVDLLRLEEPLLIHEGAKSREQALSARLRRSGQISAPTLDGLGVVDPVRSAEDERPPECDGLPALRAQGAELLGSGRRAAALVLVRNAIVKGGCEGPSFARWAAGIYTALGRREYAEVALRSYL